MEPWQRAYIEKNLPELVDSTKCNARLFTELTREKVLAAGDIADIEALRDPYSKAYELYDVLQKRSGAYEKITVILYKLQTASSEAVQILLKGFDEQGLPRPSQTLPAAPNAQPPNPQPEPPVVPPQQTPVIKSPSPPAINVEKDSRQIQMNKPMQDESGSGGGPMPFDTVDFKDNMNPLDVVVRKPEGRMAFQDDAYGLREGFKGYALVLNITDFTDDRRNRSGAKLDTGYMTQLWTQLGYEVTCEEGHFGFLEVDAILEKFKSKFAGKPRTSCVVFVGSHGQFSSIEASDGKPINLYKDIIYKFDSKNCPDLKGRPKIFIIQACQRFETDATPTAPEHLPNPINDAIVCFSTIPGYVSNRDMFLGTWYTYCLTKVFMEEAHRMDLLKMLKKVQETMRGIVANAPEGQLSTYMDMGIRTLYFNIVSD